MDFQETLVLQACQAEMDSPVTSVFLDDLVIVALMDYQAQEALEATLVRSSEKTAYD